MIAVGIETSGQYGSVAVVRDDVCLAERTLSRTGRRHARTLVVELRLLLQSVQIASSNVDVVAVSIGPGSFTGLRVGIVCGKTMAYATRTTLIAVDSFEAVARNAPPDVARQFVMGDAQRGDVFVGQYHRSANGRWQREGEIQMTGFASWRDELPRDAVFSGPGLQTYGVDLKRHGRLLERECWTPRASHIAHIGVERAATGISDDPLLIDPVYIRKSSAEEKLGLRRD